MRYVFGLEDKSLKAEWPNLLEVVFDPKFATEGRYMAYAGGWDWAPYPGTKSADDAFSLSRGLVKDVYLLRTAPAGATIDRGVLQMLYKGEYPQDAAGGRHARRFHSGCEGLLERESCHLWCAVTGYGLECQGGAAC